MKKITNLFFIITILFLGLFLFTSNVEAGDPKLNIRDDAYSAKYVSQSIPDPIEIEAGKTKEVVIKFKNIGTATWNSNSRYISAYTVEPKYRESEFVNNSWVSAKQTSKILGTVKPGEIGELKINLKAPQKTGEYVERFYLAAENWTWVKNSYFYFKINVVPAKTVVEDVAEVNEEVDIEEDMYKAKRILINKREIIAKGGEKVKIIVGYRNKGSVSWNGYSLLAGLPTQLASVTKISFADDSWKGGSLVLNDSEVVEPGKVLRSTFYFRAPSKKGVYTTQFYLKTGNEVLEDTLFELPVTVTENAPVNYQAPKFENNNENNEIVDFIPRLKEEPRIRVGLSTDNNYTHFVSYEEDYNVFNNSSKVGVLPKKKIAVLKYKNSKYYFTGAGIEFDTTGVIRLEPVSNPHAVFTLPLLSRQAKWVNANNFNKYRGAFEYRRGEKDGILYVVNDLFLEDYVAGLAETSSRAPEEMIKANVTAARTYAYVSKGKYPFFDLVGSTYDQLYLGYVSEQSLPVVVQAAKNTRGYMVTYKDEVVITPYFGNSSGWTRSWASVWGGKSKPWLVPVKANYDAGRRMLGHGVGMSQRDAAYRAEEEGLKFDELLRYYYTGVEVERIYE